MTSVKVIVTKLQVGRMKGLGQGKFLAVTQPIPGTGCTSLPVYLPNSVVWKKNLYVGQQTNTITPPV